LKHFPSVGCEFTNEELTDGLPIAPGIAKHIRPSHKPCSFVKTALPACEKAYALYEKFRPEIPLGNTGWGSSRKLDLDLNLAKMG